MHHQGATVFIRFPSEAKQPTLYPTTVVQTESASSFAVKPEDETLAFEVGLEVLIYFELGGKFVQQPACIEALPGDDLEVGIVLKTLGEWTSAENRQTYRVCTVLSDLTVTFDGQQGCTLQDISVTGFAVVAAGEYKIGQIVDVELSHDGTQYTGRVSIQSVRELPDGKTRYGTNCVKEDPCETSLIKGVQQISVSEERQRLSRLSRGA